MIETRNILTIVVLMALSGIIGWYQGKDDCRVPADVVQENVETGQAFEEKIVEIDEQLKEDKNNLTKQLSEALAELDKTEVNMAKQQTVWYKRGFSAGKAQGHKTPAGECVVTREIFEVLLYTPEEACYLNGQVLSGDKCVTLQKP